MRRALTSLLGALSLLIAVGCAPTGINTPTVYQPASGTIALRWRLGLEGIQQIHFLLDDTPLGNATSVGSSFVFQLDTTRFTNGYHTLKAVALDASGQPVRTVLHTLLIQN